MKASTVPLRGCILAYVMQLNVVHALTRVLVDFVQNIAVSITLSHMLLSSIGLKHFIKDSAHTFLPLFRERAMSSAVAA